MVTEKVRLKERGTEGNRGKKGALHREVCGHLGEGWQKVTPLFGGL